MKGRKLTKLKFGTTKPKNKRRVKKWIYNSVYWRDDETELLQIQFFLEDLK